MKLQDLQAGDLLFMRDNQAMSQAIQQATGQYSHVAIYFNQMIYHATRDKGVVRENLREFLLTHEQLVSVYRYPKINPDQVLVAAKALLGKPYNDSFYPDNGTYYCSQYIAEILPIFKTVPMQFGDNLHVISDFWQTYYDKLGLAVPLNQAGTNPSQLSQSEDLQYLGELHDYHF
ncbi:UDP-N-acetylmuramoylalanyl-D-glutamate--2,6-diaminopimelate ligase [Streptococcus infantarius subsp. infantarius]|jgi:hypothetical protein|uniref:YiiX/YebB-like N1pC/P60 family cysteine hydrolase n=1 Tax=Streptococcus infantarius TaxID=102684 RepID=UPI001BD9806D|nr:YiiX/YebB-like N1pC/P60 family cysteine hydrolase [Streptococcus infantarius]MBT0903310.1 UDP-N-acetylmuramoylalanyl-D-glutamate--2,6-diaminopimelate ligase [Streptococcus infantarius subsp. infantarius]MBT0917231.1 UDP-N-acetylmuramoylalanyl-D-glutamate--2,6-diaminopimelate ligase [Streptococcus infantarius subsp. infantarius]MCO4591142.1 hypothetical protein [Streptococcus infantarius subsp. infantarius]